jgi:hypothetical protein
MALLALASCEPNRASSVLIPTGIRPRPDVGEGVVVGRLVFDPLQAPDLDSPPYPLSVVELWSGGAAIATDTLAPMTRDFEFRGLYPGEYTVVASARFFRRTSLPPVRVVSAEVNVGELVLPILPAASSVDIHLVGEFNGFTFIPFAPDDSVGLEQIRSGLWYGPNLYPVDTGSGEEDPDTALTLPAGLHHFRFITDFAEDNPTDYGGDPSQTIAAPAAFVPIRLVSGPGTNLSVQLPVTGRYRFFLDERRLTFTIEQVPDTGPAPTSYRAKENP